MATKLFSTPDAMCPPSPDAIEVLLTLSVDEYNEIGNHLERLRETWGFPRSASTTEILFEALRRQAAQVDERPFYTTQSLAKRLSVTERHIRKLLERGELDSYRVGKARRIDPMDVESYLASKRDEGRSASTEAKSHG